MTLVRFNRNNHILTERQNGGVTSPASLDAIVTTLMCISHSVPMATRDWVSSLWDEFRTSTNRLSRAACGDRHLCELTEALK
eukprot:6188250-Pleurochrysis_carterae.AAC.1